MLHDPTTVEIVEDDMGAAAAVAAAQVIHIGQMVVIIIILSHATATTTTDPTTSSNVMFQHKFTSRGGHPSKWSSSSWMCSLSRRRRTISRLGFTQRICPFVRPSVICPESDSTLPDIFQHNNWWSKRAIERLPGSTIDHRPPFGWDLIWSGHDIHTANKYKAQQVRRPWVPSCPACVRCLSLVKVKLMAVGIYAHYYYIIMYVVRSSP